MSDRLQEGHPRHIVEANRLCNELGLDTISTGNLIGFLMECFQRGLVSERDVGFPLDWGEHDKMPEFNLLETEGDRGWRGEHRL